MTVWIALLALVSCRPEEGAADGPTWHADVAPIVAAHCGACHAEGGVASLPLDTHARAAPLADAMIDAVASGRMPPWGAVSSEACTPRLGFRDDPRLDAAELATLAAWADAGAPEGDPATAMPLPAAPDTDLDGANQILSPGRAWSASGERDEYRCTALDPELAETRWLTGLQVVPGDAETVHHVLVYSDATRWSAARAASGESWSCFGGPGGPGALVGAWAPGAVPFEPPDGAGIPVTAGSLLVMQVHYHPSGAAAPDRTALQLRWTDTQPPRSAALALLGNAGGRMEGLQPGPDDSDGVPEFRIPAGAPDHTERIAYPMLAPADGFALFAVGAHMHYIGTGMRIEVTHARPAEGVPATECLLDVPRWDFDWQRAYVYDAHVDELPRLRTGDTLRLRCAYDNTLANPGTRRALSDAGLDAPVDVFLGEETLDEMCLGVFGLVGG